MTKKLWTILALGLAVTLPSAFGSGLAAPLSAPGSVPVVPANGSAPPPGLSGGTIVATTTQSYTNSSLPAVGVTVTEDVVKETGGTYDFYYMFTNTSTNADALNAVSMTNYTGFTTAVAFLTGTGIIPANASRDAGGDTVTFGYTNATGAATLLAGTSTDWLEIDTNAPAYDQNGFTGAIDGGGFNHDSFFEPAVPEPVSMGLLGGGLALLGIARWRRSTKKG